MYTSKSLVALMATTLLGSASAVMQTVIVGSTNTSQVIYTPAEITAAAGDVIRFQFSLVNHTVTQSAAETPCTPLAGGINSGFVPGSNQTEVTTFDVAINDTNPIYIYCAQGKHCQGGMVMTINAAGAQDFATYKAAAAKAAANVPGTATSGGVFGKLITATVPA